MGDELAKQWGKIEEAIADYRLAHPVVEPEVAKGGPDDAMELLADGAPYASTLLTGTATPGPSVGRVGDTFLDTMSNRLYVKSNRGWDKGTDLMAQNAQKTVAAPKPSQSGLASVQNAPLAAIQGMSSGMNAVTSAAEEAREHLAEAKKLIAEAEQQNAKSQKMIACTVVLGIAAVVNVVARIIF